MATKHHRWAKTGRLPQIEPGDCSLCEEVARCFAFVGEGYTVERLCKDCLIEAVRLLEQGDE